MTHSVLFYLIFLANGVPVQVKAYANYEVYSRIPIVECSGWVYTHPLTKERSITHSCVTERLYAQMTGEEIHNFTTSGLFQI